jgi:hypothetical protein
LEALEPSTAFLIQKEGWGKMENEKWYWDPPRRAGKWNVKRDKERTIGSAFRVYAVWGLKTA